MPDSHHWVTYRKNKISVKGCSRCGQIMLPTNEHSQCHPVSIEKHTLIQKGYRIVDIDRPTKVA